MKIKDILGKVDNVDVYDDFAEELGIAYCGDNVIVEINKLAIGEDERLLQLATGKQITITINIGG